MLHVRPGIRRHTRDGKRRLLGVYRDAWFVQDEYPSNASLFPNFPSRTIYLTTSLGTEWPVTAWYAAGPVLAAPHNHLCLLGNLPYHLATTVFGTRPHSDTSCRTLCVDHFTLACPLLGGSDEPFFCPIPLSNFTYSITIPSSSGHSSYPQLGTTYH